MWNLVSDVRLQAWSRAQRGDGHATVRSLCTLSPLRPREEWLATICPEDFLSEKPKAITWCAELTNRAFFDTFYYYYTDRGIVSRIPVTDVNVAHSEHILDLLTELSGKKEGLYVSEKGTRDDITPVRLAYSCRWLLTRI